MRSHHNHGSEKLRRKRLRAANKKKKAERKEQRSRDVQVTARYGERAHMMCGRKIRYQTKADAMTHAVRSTYYSHDPLRVYQCPYCLGWHITSKAPLGK